MTIGQILFTVAVVVIWTWFGANQMEDILPNETPKGMKAIGYCLVLGPLLGTLLVAMIFCEIFFPPKNSDRNKAKREQQRQYEGDELLKKIKLTMDNPANYQYEVDGVWLGREEAIKKMVDNYFRKA